MSGVELWGFEPGPFKETPHYNHANHNEQSHHAGDLFGRSHIFPSRLSVHQKPANKKPGSMLHTERASRAVLSSSTRLLQQSKQALHTPVIRIAIPETYAPHSQRFVTCQTFDTHGRSRPKLLLRPTEEKIPKALILKDQAQPRLRPLGLESRMLRPDLPRAGCRS